MIRLIGLITAFLLLSACTKLFFFPYKQFAGVPSQLGYDYEDVWLHTRDDIMLHAWLIKPKFDHIGTLFFLHGNAENISTHIHSVLWLVAQGYEVLALDYRGFGQSAGQPDIPEVFDDIDAGYEWLKKRSQGILSAKPTYLFAQSLGASLGIKYLADHAESREYFKAVILEAAFTRYGVIARKVAASHWISWLFQYPVEFLLSGDYDPIDAIDHLTPLPILLLHSRQDKVIPFSHGMQLFARAKYPKVFVEAQGPHIQAIRDSDTRNKILEFIQFYE